MEFQILYIFGILFPSTIDAPKYANSSNKFQKLPLLHFYWDSSCAWNSRVLQSPFKFSNLPTALQLTVLDPTALVPHKRVDSMTATTSLTIIIFTSHKINMVHRRKSSERILTHTAFLKSSNTPKFSANCTIETIKND